MNKLYEDIMQKDQNSIQAKYEQFKKQFSGNAQEQVQQLLNSGKMKQETFNRLRNIAQKVLGAKF